MTEHQKISKPSRWKHHVKGIFIVLIIALIMLGLSERGAFHQWEMYGVDQVLSSGSYKSSNTWLVQITDEDYSAEFQSTSPLCRSKVMDLVVALARAHPAMIVVDLDLSDPVVTCQGFGRTYPATAHFPEILQAEVKKQVGSTPILIFTQMTDAASDAAGLQRIAPDPTDTRRTHFALPLFPRDRDGVVRSYVRTVDVNEDGRCMRWPTLAWAAAASRGGVVIEPTPCGEPSDKDNQRWLNFSGERYTFNRVDVNSVLNSSSPSSVLSDKIVIVGGAFAAGRDEYFTPVGQKQGMELIAFALETEIRGPTTLYTAAEIFGMDMCLGILIVVLDWKLKSSSAAIWSTVCVALVGPFLVSRFVFGSFNFFFSFFPVCLGALIHISLGAFSEVHKLGAELEGRQKDLKEKEDEIARLRAVEESLKTTNHGNTGLEQQIIVLTKEAIFNSNL